MANELEKHAEGRILQGISLHKKTIQAILGKEVDQARWLRLIIGEIRRNPALAECKPDSLINAVLLAASMKIEIAPGRSYLVPFKGECTLIIDYRQKVDLARRSGIVRAVYADVVCEADEFNLHIDSTDEVVHFKHRPALLSSKGGKLVPVDDRGAVVLAYAIAGYTDGGMPQFAAITRRDLDAIKEKMTGNMRNPQRSPWVTHEEEMQKKTALRRLCKLLPQEEGLALSQEVDAAVEAGEPLPTLIEVEFGQEPINPIGSYEDQERVAEKKLVNLRKPKETKAQPQSKAPEPAESAGGKTNSDGGGGSAPAPVSGDTAEFEEAMKHPVTELMTEDEGQIRDGAILFWKADEGPGEFRKWSAENGAWEKTELPTAKPSPRKRARL